MYTTPALVCGSKSDREHDRVLLLLTRDAGMVWARASGARKDISKLRYALQEFSLSRISLVHGKHGWRVTGAEPEINFYYVTQSREAKAVIMRGIKLLRRLVAGEEPHPDLFLSFIDAMKYFSRQSNIEPHQESIFLYRILFMLGYVGDSRRTRAVISASSLEEAVEVFGEHLSGLKNINKEIEKSLVASQL